MPDQATRNQVCPSCGRRVPHTVAKCRCGAVLPDDESADDESGPAAKAIKLALVAMLGIAAISGATYLIAGRLTATPSPAVRPRAASPAPAEPEATAPTAAAAAPSDTTSGAARAWNLAASAPQPGAPSAEPVSSAIAPAGASSGPAGSIEEMVDRVMPAIVLIQTSGGRGSGFFISRDTLITNQHVVEDDTYVTLQRIDGTKTTAHVESRSPALDLAILKVAQPLASQPVISMGSAHSLKPGQEIIVIGSALGTLQNSVSRGIVSGLRTAGGATLVQTDAAINPGNSGGPMLDRNGSVVGITTMGYRGAEGLGFGVAIDHARDLLEGRQANLGTTRGLRDIQAQSSSSESERQQQQGEDQLRAQVGQLAQAAGTLDAGWGRYRKECYTSSISGVYDHEWFAMLVPNGMPPNAAGGCTTYYNAIDADIKQFKSLMQRTVGDARRANVLPGTIRDILRSNRLDFEWDR